MAMSAAGPPVASFRWRAYSGYGDFVFPHRPHLCRLVARTHDLYVPMWSIWELAVTSTSPISYQSIQVPLSYAHPCNEYEDLASGEYTFRIYFAIADYPFNDICRPVWNTLNRDQRTSKDKLTYHTVLPTPLGCDTEHYVAIVTLEKKVCDTFLPIVISQCMKSVGSNRVKHYDLSDGKQVNVQPAFLMILLGHGDTTTSVYSHHQDARYVKYDVDYIAKLIGMVKPALVLTGVCFGARRLVPELHHLLPDITFFGYWEELYASTVTCGSFNAFLLILLLLCHEHHYLALSSQVPAFQESTVRPLSMWEALFQVSRICVPWAKHQSDPKDLTLYNAKYLSQIVDFLKVQQLQREYNQHNSTQTSTSTLAADSAITPTPVPLPLSVYRARYHEVQHINTQSLSWPELNYLKSVLEISPEILDLSNRKPTITPTTTATPTPDQDHKMPDQDDMDTSFGRKKVSM